MEGGFLTFFLELSPRDRLSLTELFPRPHAVGIRKSTLEVLLGENETIFATCVSLLPSSFPTRRVLNTYFLLPPQLLVCLCLVGQCLSRGRGRGRVNYHTIYAREAKPYSSIKFDKNLPYVPRYRWGLREYTLPHGLFL